MTIPLEGRSEKELDIEDGDGALGRGCTGFDLSGPIKWRARSNQRMSARRSPEEFESSASTK